ncbi:MAG: hypothetical protein JWM27_4560 [Gemmatimonadetes bacterium]|nr:hypothetical protein [Gemmatimonadota bacterium]
MPLPDDLHRKLSAAHTEALAVGDSPLRADRLADQLPPISLAVAAADAADELKSRIRAALADAERVLRRDDDGREAARHLASALRLVDAKPRAPSPFGDD